MTTRQVTGVILRGDGTPWANAPVVFRIIHGTYHLSPDETIPGDTIVGITNGSGVVLVSLVSGLALTYRVTLPDGSVFDISVPIGPPTTLETLRATYLGSVPTPDPTLETIIIDVLRDVGLLP